MLGFGKNANGSPPSLRMLGSQPEEEVRLEKGQDGTRDLLVVGRT